MTISLSCQRIDRFDFSRVIFLEDELVRELAYFMEKVIIIGLLVPVSTKSCSGIIALESSTLVKKYYVWMLDSWIDIG